MLWILWILLTLSLCLSFHLWVTTSNVTWSNPRRLIASQISGKWQHALKVLETSRKLGVYKALKFDLKSTNQYWYCTISYHKDYLSHHVCLTIKCAWECSERYDIVLFHIVECIWRKLYHFTSDMSVLGCWHNKHLISKVKMLDRRMSHIIVLLKVHTYMQSLHGWPMLFSHLPLL